MIKYDTESNWPTAPRWTHSNLALFEEAGYTGDYYWTIIE
jgi:hypothetical protein